MFELIFGDLSLSVPTAVLSARCQCFSATHPSPYRIRSDVASSSFRDFAATLESDSIHITSDNVADLGQLADEFSFDGLQREVSVHLLSRHLQSDFRQFIFTLSEGLSRLERLICHGFGESSSQKMLVLAGGNFSRALSALEQLPVNSEFTSSVPIYMCRDVFDAMKLLRLPRPPVEGVEFLRDGDTLYSFTSPDAAQYHQMGRATGQIGEDPVVRCSFTGPPFDGQWTENADNEAVFVMFGMSGTAARKLMKLARGRYYLAWAYFNRLRSRNLLHLLDQGMLFNEMKNREAVGRDACREAKGLLAMLGAAGDFTAVQILRDDRGAPDVIFSCQDAREFIHRNRDVLQELAW